MGNKIQTIYVCSACDAQSPKWSGRCLDCGGWGTLQTQTVDLSQAEKEKTFAASSAKTVDLAALSGEEKLSRLITGLNELDRVLGNGLVAGSLILLGGEPGVGKSTLVAQIADSIQSAGEVIYVSGEESAGQIKSRLDRLSITPKKIKFLSETSAEKIAATIAELKPALAIIDSIQTIHSAALAGEAGSLTQIRGSAGIFLETAKTNDTAIILIGHITKDGVLAGPKTLEHIVDTVLYLEADAGRDFRILRASKNRFGSVNEIGIFEMTGAGFKEVANPSAIFLGPENGQAGSIVSSVIEGTRAFLVEVQALATKTVFGYPQRKASGFDLNRLQVLTAVLTKRAGLNLTNQDVILNLAGGLRLSDPALDLAVCLAIASSLLNQVIGKNLIVLGEVGLGGEIRPVNRLEQRLNEAERLGYAKAIIPDCELLSKKMKLIKIKNLSEIIKYLTRP